MNTGPEITSCSVRVMRSFDYCHFEIVLGGTGQKITSADVDSLRKRAMRLADKAVEQYQVAKAVESDRKSRASTASYLRDEAKEIAALNETDRTPEQQAKLKHYNDLVFQSNRDYDYQDDWEQDQ